MAIKSKVLVSLLAMLVLALACVGCSGSSADSASAAISPSSDTSVITEVSPDNPYGSGTHHAEVTVEGYGPFTMTLVADDAPVTVANFCDLANEGFYDGTTFYRFVQDFCMQGGSSNNSAASADDGLVPIVGEFKENGINNPLANDFKKGTVAMARSNDPDSATSTFFITLATSSGVSQSLDGRYAAFGSVDEAGMAIVDQIVADYLPNVTDESMGTISSEAKQAKILSIKILD